MHTIEIWFALNGRTLYMLAGAREQSDWVKNISRLATVRVKIGEDVFNGQGRVLAAEDREEDKLARKIVFAKYAPRDSDDLTDWAHTALPSRRGSARLNL